MQNLHKEAFYFSPDLKLDKSHLRVIIQVHAYFHENVPDYTGYNEKLPKDYFPDKIRISDTNVCRKENNQVAHKVLCLLYSTYPHFPLINQKHLPCEDQQQKMELR